MDCINETSLKHTLQVAVRPRSIKEIDSILIELEFNVLYTIDDFNDLSINISVNASNECGSDVSDNIIIECEFYKIVSLAGNICALKVSSKRLIDLSLLILYIILSD